MPKTTAFRLNQRRIRAVKSLYEKTIAKSFAVRLETAPTFFVAAVEVIDSQRVRKAP